MFKSASLCLTNRCTARCRHCAVEEHLPDATPANVLNWSEQCISAGFNLIIFTGGEPFLLHEDMTLYIRTIRKKRVAIGSFSNGSWATTPREAEQRLSALRGLSFLYLSTDKYHLEHVPAQNIKIILDTAPRFRIAVVLLIAYDTRAELDEIEALYRDYQARASIAAFKVRPFGNAQSLCRKETFGVDELHRLDRRCSLGDILILQDGAVLGCGNSASGPFRYLKIGGLKTENLTDIMERFKENKLYNFLREFGPQSVAGILLASPFRARLEKERFGSECELCIKTLSDPEMYAYVSARVS